MNTHALKTQDIYESAYFLTLGANILDVEAFTENKRLVCKFTFEGDNLLQAQNDYYNGKANVNLWDFRRSFSRINSLIGSARKEYRATKPSNTREVQP